MNPLEQQQLRSDESTKEWFNGIDAPSVPPQALGNQPSSGSSKKRILIILGVIAGFVILAGIAVFVFVRPTALACLSSEDYAALTGSKQDSQLSATDAFYTQTVHFVHGGDEYSGDSEAASSAISKKIGSLYEDRSENSSLVITINSDYTADETKDIASRRSTKLKELLIRNGVNEKAINVSIPQQIISDGELSIEPEDQPTVTAYISLTSDAKCVEK